MASFLRQQLQDQSKQSIFFSAIRNSRRFEIEERKSTYSWGPPDYKIYPSGLSFTMCPVSHIKNLEKWNGIEDLGAIYRVKRGSAIHKELQQDLIKSNSLYDRPEHIEDRRIADKLKNNWPEVPFHDKLAGISGSIDCVLNYHGIPLPSEIKTTSVEPDRWENYQRNLPLANHHCQASIYCYELTVLNYYPGKEIKNYLLIYLNLLYPPGDQKAEKEFLLEYDHKKTEHLVQELTRNRNQYIAGEEMICQYQLCKIHTM